LKHIIFSVTNDLTFDQRMHRICNSLAINGYKVTLVGRKLKPSRPLVKCTYHQKRLYCFFSKGFLFYAEYNIRLFFFLLIYKFDAVCAIDLDTILPCLAISKLKNKKRIYDAHELFTELKEVRTRYRVHFIWSIIERFAVPKFMHCYTVGHGLANEFKKRYKIIFEVIRNVPILKPLQKGNTKNKIILYQGAVNEGRGFEQLIPAMKHIEYKLLICGNGNFMSQLKSLIEKNQVEDKVELKGMLPPDEIWDISQQCFLGINLVEREGLNQYLSLANKFFDYINAGIPQISMNYPEYQYINNRYEVAVLLDDLQGEVIVRCINNIMNNERKWQQLHNNCLQAREVLNWQQEEKKLLAFYEKIFAN
jgi:glycosyltransferase involved in cell wall biosynthesis